MVLARYHKKRPFESIKALREYHVRKVVLALDEQESSGEKKARMIAEELAEELKTAWNVEIVEIDKKDAIGAASRLVSLIKREDKDAILNVSGSLRTFAVAAYLAARVTGSRIIASTPRYGEYDNEAGIISATDNGVESLDDPVFRLNLGIRKVSKEFRREMSRLSHHLAKLEAAGFIRRKKVGRNVKIGPTSLGKIVAGVLACQISSSRTSGS